MTLSIVSCFHADHGVTDTTQQWAVDTIAPEGFFLATLELPENHADLENNLYGPVSGDAPVTDAYWKIRDPSDPFRSNTHFVDLPPRKTRLLTVIGMEEKGEVTLFTCYGGPAAERVPSDPSLAEDVEGKLAAQKFWKDHALSSAAAK